MDVEGAGFAVDFPELRFFRIHALAPHLASHDGALQGHDAQVVAGSGFHHHQVTGFDALARRVHVNALAGVLETHLEVIVELFLGDALEHVVHLQLATALAVSDIFFAGFLVGYNGAAAETVVLDGFVRKLIHNVYN